MKKILAMILVISMIGTFSCFSFAEQNTEKLQSVLALVKGRIGSTDEYTQFESSYNSYDGIESYSFNWSNNADGAYSNLNVSANGEGIITNYSRYSSNDYQTNRKPSVNKMTADEALKKTHELINKLNPDLKDKVKLENSVDSESLYNDGFNFQIQRYENGIPVSNDRGFVSVSNDATKIMDYSIQYTEGLKFDKTEGVISKDAAKKAFDAKIGIKASWYTEYKDKTRTVYPAYMPNETNRVYINALTGEKVEMPDTIHPYYAKGDRMTKEAASMDSGGFTGAELSEIDNVSGLLSKDEIIKLLKENKTLEYPKDLELNSFRTYKDYYAKDLYYTALSFANDPKDGKDDYKYTEYEVNSKTGEIIRYYTSYNERDIEKFNAEKAKKSADKALTELAKDKAKEFSEGVNQYGNNFVYTRNVQNLPYPDNCITIGISNEGKVIGYNVDYSDITFPSVEKIISKEEASKKLFEQVDYNLMYIPTKSDEKLKRNDKAIIVYAFDEDKTSKIDAFTGKLLGYDSQEYKEEVKEYTDIEGHYAAEQIKTLFRFGIKFDGDKFKPDEVITQQEYLSLLIAAFMPGEMVTIKRADKPDDLYTKAKNYGLIKDGEIAPDSSVTRADAAKFMIRAMGIEEYAQLSNIYVCPFKDVTKLIGQISILGAMGIFKGDSEGNFNPDKNLTRADSAIVIYNFLSR
ncbi:MAG: S-layer homology domain-containing protein [Bacillota bacterium]|nr:S-layer homology domain-containing protein [Bacillota bacterium]